MSDQEFPFYSKTDHKCTNYVVMKSGNWSFTHMAVIHYEAKVGYFSFLLHMKKQYLHSYWILSKSTFTVNVKLKDYP